MLRTQDLRVGITINEAQVPMANKVFEIGVICKKKSFDVPTTYNLTSELFTDTTNGANNTNAQFVLVLDGDNTGTSTYTADQLTEADVKEITWSVNEDNVITVVLGTDTGSGAPLPEIVLTPQDSNYNKYTSGDAILYTNDLSQYVYHLITDKTQFVDYVDPMELPELEGGFSGKAIHTWMVSDISEIPNIIDDVNSKVKTVILTSYITSQIANNNIGFNGIQVYTFTSNNPWQNDLYKNIALKQCGFVDPEKEGKVLYSFSNLLKNYPIVTNQTTIKNSLFHSVFQSRIQRDLLVQNNFSFWMEALEGSFLWDVYVGGKQIQAKYCYFILEEEISFVISTWINQGQNYTNDALLNLKGEVANRLVSLKDQTIIGGYNITFTSVEDQQASDKIKGIVKGFTINFDEQYRIAQVNILIKGEI